MDLEVDSKAGESTTNISIRLTDHTDGEQDLVDLFRWLELSGDDRLLVTSNNNVYEFTDFDDNDGIYIFEIPSVSPSVFGVTLERAANAGARTGEVELFHQLTLNFPIAGAIFQAGDTVETQWSLNGMPPSEAFAEHQLRTMVTLTNCVDSAGNIVIENDPERNPGRTFGWPQLGSGTHTASAKTLLELAAGADTLEFSPAIASCKLQIGAFTQSIFTGSGADSLVKATVDPTLALQEWTVRYISESVEVTILR